MATANQIRKILEANGITKHIVEINRDEVEILVKDTDESADAEATEMLMEKVSQLLGFKSGYKSGYGSWVIRPAAPRRYRHD